MRRKVVLLILVVAVAPLSVASTAWACAALATLKMESKVLKPGQTVAVTGSGFSDTHSGLGAGDSAVSLRLKSRRGKVLKEVDAVSGKISTTLGMPATMAPGYYVLLATQTQADGSARAGTPARYAFRVTGAPEGQTVAAPPWSNAPGGPSSSGPVAGDAGGVNGGPLLVGGILAVTLLAAGSVLVGRRNRTLTLSV